VHMPQPPPLREPRLSGWCKTRAGTGCRDVCFHPHVSPRSAPQRLAHPPGLKPMEAFVAAGGRKNHRKKNPFPRSPTCYARVYPVRVTVDPGSQRDRGETHSGGVGVGGRRRLATASVLPSISPWHGVLLRPFFVERAVLPSNSVKHAAASRPAGSKKVENIILMTPLFPLVCQSVRVDRTKFKNKLVRFERNFVRFKGF